MRRAAVHDPPGLRLSGVLGTLADVSLPVTTSHTRGDPLHRLLNGSRAERLTHAQEVPARPAVNAPWPGWVHADVRAALEARGVVEP